MRHAEGIFTSKMSMAGWWMVHTIVRPVSATLRTTLITMLAALASSPVHRALLVKSLFICPHGLDRRSNGSILAPPSHGLALKSGVTFTESGTTRCMVRQ